MESPGKYLKMERESRNLSLRQVSEATRIHERLLRAIEEDRYEAIASPLYVKGFLEAYSKYLGLDPNEIVLQYRKEHGGRNALTRAELSDRMAPRKKRTRVWLLLTALLLVLAFILIYMFSPSTRF
jgi:cytoskeletal protein RodZ